MSCFVRAFCDCSWWGSEFAKLADGRCRCNVCWCGTPLKSYASPVGQGKACGIKYNCFCFVMFVTLLLTRVLVTTINRSHKLDVINAFSELVVGTTGTIMDADHWHNNPHHLTSAPRKSTSQNPVR
ncbi:hypothetical protein SKAU_G00014070 [Synaphobranchus kaupii]|uniref:Uncharacterized protein n=1 Tax=Synaphobranchus kaupii TaxID=118154 RepID=A0A9Q1GAL2_SYNKA|nr:hypothetical protein SKAU_G00014070 [Synaphobranchus kaupii]